MYKRQGEEVAEVAKWSFICLDEFRSVSYTHLDVYKRQGIPMDFYTRARAVGGAAKMSNKKDVKIAFAKRDFAAHFKDSVDYELSLIHIL